MTVSAERVVSALDEAYQLFSNNPDIWVKGKLAEDEKGNDCSPRSKKAAKFCAIAIMQKVLNANDSNPTYQEAVTQLNITVGKLYGKKFNAVECMNDGKTGFKQVLRVFKETIKRLSKYGLADAKSETVAVAKPKAKAKKKTPTAKKFPPKKAKAVKVKAVEPDPTPPAAPETSTGSTPTT